VPKNNYASTLLFLKRHKCYVNYKEYR